MDFDYNLKKEILLNISDSTAYLKGILSSIGRIDKVNDTENISVTHIMYQVALDVVRAVRALYSRAEIEMTFDEPHGAKKSRGYVIIIDGKTTKEIIRDFKPDIIDGKLVFKKDFYSGLWGNTLIGFLQGVYLSKGRVFLPKEDEEGKSSSLYQLEIILNSKREAEKIKELINRLNIQIKDGERRDSQVLYLKDSEAISDFIALLKASDAVLQLQSLIVERDVRNNANRAVNCSVANINKSVTAASLQIEAIKKIDRLKGINTLEEKLRELCRLRLDYPEATLSDLSVILKGVTKSGINHRMRKIMMIAESLREE